MFSKDKQCACKPEPTVKDRVYEVEWSIRELKKMIKDLGDKLDYIASVSELQDHTRLDFYSPSYFEDLSKIKLTHSLVHTCADNRWKTFIRIKPDKEKDE